MLVGGKSRIAININIGVSVSWDLIELPTTTILTTEEQHV